MPCASNPTGAEIKRRRLAAGLSRKDAAALVGVAYRTFQDWERDVAKMRTAYWELFKMKIRELEARNELST